MTKIELRLLLILSLIMATPFIMGFVRYRDGIKSIINVDYGEYREYYVNGEDYYEPGTKVVLYCDYETPSIETNPTFCVDDAGSVTTWDDERHMYVIKFTMPNKPVKIRIREVDNWNGVEYLIL